ncbi:copper homeostasis CutC domain-containing protein [Gloeopeniophorella convolvens]|nr:copper homeostasis CutC domain-containing protein [Gloeopeniophorella convolvens]
MPWPKLVLEVCVDSVQSAASAIRGGADRLEVCGNLGIGGGTTPSLGLIRAIQKAAPNIPIMAMVRPRAGDFFYSADELDVMLEDIGVFKNAGVEGVVFGVLDAGGSVDVPRTRMCVTMSRFLYPTLYNADRLVEAALPMHVCFHRAFDMSRSAIESLDRLCGVAGITRILTSGQSTSVLRGLQTLEALFHRSQKVGSPSILPGSCINPATIRDILDRLLPCGLKEVHMSGGRWVEGGSSHRPQGMGMGACAEGEWGVWLTNEDAVRGVRRIADEVCSG